MKADFFRHRAALLCLAAGALLPLSFAPFYLWYVAPLCLALWLGLLQEGDGKTLFLRSWCFGSGMFGSGVSWVYVSIHEYGYASIPLAALLTALFVIGLGFLFALPVYFYHRYDRQQPSTPLLVFPCLWVLGEWMRSWFLTGFPWLYLGSAHVDTPLAGWLPVAGVYAASWITAFSAAALLWLVKKKTLLPLGLSALLFASGYVLQQVSWTRLDRQHAIQVGLVQPNFSLHDKWNPDNRSEIRQTLADLSAPLWHNDVVLWPEAALNELYHDALPFLQTLQQSGAAVSATLITGVLSYDVAQSTNTHPVIYNSIVATGTGSGMYHKVRLVPFGEYVPLEKGLRGLIRFFDLPSSHMSRGPQTQAPLQVGRYRVAPFICYEIVYPDLVARNSRATAFLVTISNDSWFGDSLGPQQHLQMAQVRAVETGRYVIRGTNDGISAIIDPRGTLLQTSQRFTRQTVQGSIYPARGATPFMRWGSWPWMLAWLLLLFALAMYQSAWRRKNAGISR